MGKDSFVLLRLLRSRSVSREFCVSPQRGLGGLPAAAAGTTGQEEGHRVPAVQPSDTPLGTPAKAACAWGPRRTALRPPTAPAPTARRGPRPPTPHTGAFRDGSLGLGEPCGPWGTPGARTSCPALQGRGVQGAVAGLPREGRALPAGHPPTASSSAAGAPGTTVPQPGRRAQRWPVHGPHFGRVPGASLKDS